MAATSRSILGSHRDKRLERMGFQRIHGHMALDAKGDEYGPVVVKDHHKGTHSLFYGKIFYVLEDGEVWEGDESELTLRIAIEFCPKGRGSFKPYPEGGKILQVE